MFVRNVLTVLIIGVTPVTAAFASGGGPAIPSQEWSFSGAFGTYDKAAMQRGYKIYREVCSSCHAMKRVYFRNLEALGYNETQIKNIAAEYTVINEEPNDEGEMFERSALPSDAFVSPFANDNAAKYANGGALPPDLSLITKARANGSNYVWALLTGYEETPPHGEELSEGQYWNTYFSGHKLSMAPPLMEELVSYEDGTPETVDQYARDIAQFLTWAADPHMEERKSTGFKVIIFLMMFAGVMLSVKRKIWKDVH
ncbi:MAG: cytochrome c1 [Zetaproteobacteria bacterium]|nr:MAG: cytochrome c1 [Zetaproteobacteria bacterium]